MRTHDRTALVDKDAQPADPEAELDIIVPLGDREINLRMRDLIGGDRR